MSAPPVLLAGTANPALAAALAAELGVTLGACDSKRFPDGELEIAVRCELRDRDVFIVQSTRPPVGEHLLELTLLADACHRGGARSVTAVISYLGYARQDRRESNHEPLGAKVVGELLSAGGVDRVICLDLHNPGVEGCFRQPMEQATVVPALAERLKGLTVPAVVVSPDLGGLKRAEAFARLLGLPVAVVHKQRLSGAQVAALGVVGEVKGHHAILVDDMLSTGGTMVAAANAVVQAGALPKVSLVVAHGLFVGPALERLKTIAIERIVVSDSVPPPENHGLLLDVVSCAPTLAEVVRRLHQKG